MWRYLSILVFVCGSARGTPSAVIYDNTVTPTGTSRPLVRAGQIFGDFEIGNEVTPAGTERFITGLDILVQLTGAESGAFEFRIIIARETPLSNEGGWNSGFITRAVAGGSPVVLHFDVPFFQVLDRFTWLIYAQRSQPEPSELSLPQFDPPAIGTAPRGFWVSGELQPYHYVFSDDPPFAVLVRAVVQPPPSPIPTVSERGVAVCILLLTTAGTWILYRRQHKTEAARR